MTFVRETNTSNYDVEDKAFPPPIDAANDRYC